MCPERVLGMVRLAGEKWGRPRGANGCRAAPWSAVIFGAVWLLQGAVPAAAQLAAAPLPAAAPRSALDDATLAAAGIRKLDSRHLTLYTDLPAGAAIDELPAVFDQAVVAWHDYFGQPAQLPSAWHLTGFLMRNDDRFREYGLLPDTLPDFLHGYQRGNEFWFREQPSDFYRRHLMLHEGTHAYMEHWLHGGGAAWYREGMAELLGTHRWQKSQLTLAVMPDDRQEAEYWGRIKLVRGDIAAGRAKSLAEVMVIKPRNNQEIDNAYAWSWAAVLFLSRHPLTREAAPAWQGLVALPDAEFNRQVWKSIAVKQSAIDAAWALFLHELDYGYDLAADEIVERPVRDMPDAGTTCEIAADRGWQASGLRFQAGQWYRLGASGRYQIAAVPRPWICEPQGVTIKYHHGQPLGKLLMAIQPEQAPNQSIAERIESWQPIPVGTRLKWQAPATGVAYFRINEPAGRLSDNQGRLTIQLELIRPAESQP